MSTVYDDLDWLREHDALTGVAEIIRERRRQIEQLGWTLGHDRERHANGLIAGYARAELSGLQATRNDGLADPASDEVHLAKAGALAAAEIDRLNAEFGGGR
jgi:hypothetical protein